MSLRTKERHLYLTISTNNSNTVLLVACGRVRSRMNWKACLTEKQGLRPTTITLHCCLHFPVCAFGNGSFVAVRVLHHLRPAAGGTWTAGTILSPIPQLASFAEDLDVSRTRTPRTSRLFATNNISESGLR